MSFYNIPIDYDLFIQFLKDEGFILEKGLVEYKVYKIIYKKKVEITTLPSIKNKNNVVFYDILPYIERINRLYGNVLDNGEIINKCQKK